MIKMVKGTYGRVTSGGVEAMTKHSAPFSLSETREAELVAAGVAIKVEEPPKAYEKMKMAELRKVAAARGIDVSAAKTKKEAVAILEADEKQHSGLLAED